MKNKISAIAATTLFCLGAGQVYAAGYQLNEYSVTGLGRSFAGAGVAGDDYSALAYNPAGMVLNEKSGIQAGMNVAQIHSKITGDKADERTKMHYGVPLPSAFGQYKFNNRVTAGLGVYAPFGLKTRYKKNSYVASEGVRSELEIIDIAPAVAVRATDKLTLGGSVIIRYIHGRMTNMVPALGPSAISDFDLDGWTMSWTAGAMYEFTPKTRIGVSYKAMSMQTVKGDHEVSGTVAPYNQTVHNGKASPDLPQSVLVSGWHDITDRWSVSSSVRWTDWEDSFQEFTLASDALILKPSGGKKTVDESWQKTWTLALGTDYKLTDRWTIRFGTAWDQSPVRNQNHRTVRIPDSDRFWLSTGASYTVGNVQIDAGFAHLFMKNSTAVESAFKAHYKSYSNMFGLQLQYKF